MIEVAEANLRQFNLVEVRFKLFGFTFHKFTIIKYFFVFTAHMNELLNLVMRYFSGTATHDHFAWGWSIFKLNVAFSLKFMVFLHNSLLLVNL